MHEEGHKKNKQKYIHNNGRFYISIKLTRISSLMHLENDKREIPQDCWG